MTEAEERKLIERTCKYHAYQAVVLWAKHMPNNKSKHGDAEWYATQKMKGHEDFVLNHTHYYDYATAKVYPKTICRVCTKNETIPDTACEQCTKEMVEKEAKYE